MGGWPSTTGNPSGGGRWNNEEDDDYEDEGAPNVTTSTSWARPRLANGYDSYESRHNRQLNNQDARRAVHDAYNSNKERQGLYREISLAESKMSAIVNMSDPDYIAQKYFGEESIQGLIDTVLRPLAETCFDIAGMKRGTDNGSIMLRVMSLPKLSEADHTSIEEGYLIWRGGKYIFKSDWSDDYEEVNLVDPSISSCDWYRARIQTITREQLTEFAAKQKKFLSLVNKREEETARALEYYSLLNGDTWLKRATVRSSDNCYIFRLADHVKSLHILDHEKHHPISGPLKEISDIMDQDLLTLGKQLEKLEAKKTVMEVAREEELARYVD